jgi:DNA-binding transcriptional regulator YhcF (GntR family)
MTQPPYRRIADEIRARIAHGDLRPGDPVPSARGITREWGVALATATKVLATLNAEGVTRSLPGRGTVVTGPAVPAQPAGVSARAARNEGDPDLTRERIVAAAIRVADAEGLAQLSMRRIATELGTAPMSLYRHVSGKDELLVSMMDSVLGEDPLPARPPKGWRARLELSSRLQWQGFRRHPWLAPALSITRPQLIPNGMRHTEWALRAVDGLGLTIRR